MTALLEKAVQRARELPEEQQDALALMLLEEMEDEARWDETFSRPESHDMLRDMAAEAMKEYHAGNAEDLNPENPRRDQ
jgi:hypothetical protein